jgi:hypothetical protein
MELEEKQRAKAIQVLRTAASSLKRLIAIRFSDKKCDAFFNASTRLNCYQVELRISKGSVCSGSLSIVSSNDTQRNVFQLRSFPLYFLHRAAVIATNLLNRINYTCAHFDTFGLQTINGLFVEATRINSVFLDPDFTEILVSPFFLSPTPGHLSVHLHYADGSFHIKFSGFIGASDILAPDQNGCPEIKESEECAREVVRLLKSLLSDVSMWLART